MSAMVPSKVELEEYISENYGSCSRPPTTNGSNACYWGTTDRKLDGCLRTGIFGRCRYWVPIGGEDRQRLIAAWGNETRT